MATLKMETIDLNTELKDVSVVCINLNTRRDKKRKMIAKLKAEKLPQNFYTAKLHKNPKKGCLTSHLNVINGAVKNGVKYLLVLEDDAKFVKPIIGLPQAPTDWDMLYLGGTIKHIMEKKSDDDEWLRMACWTTHAYIINLTNKALINKINDAINYTKEIDTYYIEHIHSNFNCYMSNPMRVIQEEGYSDIEKRDVNYDFMQETLKGYSKPEHEIIKDKDGNNQYVLKLGDIKEEDLPKISIITPTRSRRHLFSIALRNYNSILYPKDKIEWIIIDDTPPEEQSVKDLIPNNKNIRYFDYYIKGQKLTVAHKRNLAASLASTDYIIHMDDDDYYPNESVLVRVKTLLNYPQIGCVGCTTIGIYNLLTNESSLSSDGPLSLSEATMAYRKSFWKTQNFNATEVTGEFKGFISGRLSQIMELPYSYIICAFNHRTNISTRQKKDDYNLKYNNETYNFYNEWDEDTQIFVDEMRIFLKKV